MTDSAGQAGQGGEVAEQRSEAEEFPATSGDAEGGAPERRHFNWTKFGAIATAVGVLVAILAWQFPLSGSSPGPGNSADVSTPASDPTHPSARSDPADGAANAERTAAGTCLESPGDLTTVVACDVSHAAEIMSIGEKCSEAATIRYLGGDPDIDVLSTRVEVTEVNGHCVVSYAGEEVATSFADALELDSGVALRECLDSRSNQFVACSEDHTGEVVARLNVNSSDSLDCQGKARDYMDQSLSERYDELTVDEVTTESARRCVVSMRSDNRWMKSSLRAVGRGDIKTEPMD